eukprot:COSAG01_NODE_560_length_15462_cov_18.361192_10_plen_119_part_00
MHAVFRKSNGATLVCEVRDRCNYLQVVQVYISTTLKVTLRVVQGKFMFDLLVPILFLFSAVTLLHGVIVAVIRGRRRSTLSSQSSNQGPFQNRSFWHKLRAAYLDVVIFAVSSLPRHT